VQLIPCPWCGPRAHIEFRYHCDACAVPRDWLNEPAAEAHARIWLRDNHIGAHDEVWQHTDGCHGWLSVTRNNLTHVIESTRPLGPAALAPGA
jgi:heterotetrameric sarcosine oxidase delta subunit